MDIKDVKVGMKVVPHDKSDGKGWRTWRDCKSPARRHLDEHGYISVTEIQGKRVVCEGDFFEASDLTAATIEVGDVVCPKCPDTKDLVVSRIDGRHIYLLYGNGETTREGPFSFTECELDLVRKAKKPAEPEKPWRPKIGDKVVFVSEAHQGGVHPKVGTVGTFTRDDGSNNPEFTWPDPLGKHYCTISFLRPATADEIAESEKPAERRPTVGDWVEVLAKPECGHKVGDIGKVVPSSGIFPYLVDVNGKQAWYRANEVKLTTAPTQKPEAEKPREFKVGGCVFDEWCTATVLRSEAEAAVRRAYCEGFSDGQKHIVGCVVDPKPTRTALAKFWEADA